MSYLITSTLHTIKDFLVGQNYQKGSMGHQYTPQRIILPSESFTKDFPVSQKTKNLCTYPLRIEYDGMDTILVKRKEYITCAHILQELNMQAQIPYELEEKLQNLCTYPPRFENAGIEPMQAKICAHIARELNMQAHQKRQIPRSP